MNSLNANLKYKTNHNIEGEVVTNVVCHITSNCLTDASPSFQIALWCNGSTTVFGSVGSGSNPDKATKDDYIDFYNSIT